MTFKLHPKDHLFCKWCLHDLQFMKTRSFSPNLSKLARAAISYQFMKTRSLCRHCLQNEWTLAKCVIELLNYLPLILSLIDFYT